MKTLNIYINSLKQYLLQIKLYILMFLIIPLIMSYIYGIIYKKMADPNRTLPSFSVMYINNDGDELSKPLEEVFNNKKISSIVHLQKFSKTIDVDSKLIDGTYSAAIIIPKNFSSNIEKGKNVSIEVIKAPSAGVNGDFIDSIVTSYTKNLNVNSAVYSVLINTTKDAGVTQQIYNSILPQIMGILNKNYIQYDNLSTTKKISSSQDFAANMLIMFSLFISMSAASTVVLERENGTLNRIAATSTSKLSYCLGRLLGTFTVSIIQITVFAVASSLISGVDWGNKLLFILTILLHSLIIAALTSLIIGLFKDQKKMNVFASIILIIMSMLSGAMTPSDYIVGSYKTLSHFSINYWIKSSYTNIMLGDSFSSISINFAMLLLISIIFIIIGNLSFKYSE